MTGEEKMELKVLKGAITGESTVFVFESKGAAWRREGLLS